MNMDYETKNYYKVTGKGLEYAKGFVQETKRLNPNIDISIKWVSKNYLYCTPVIICSTPLEQMSLPGGYYGEAIGRIMFPIEQEEYKEITKNNDVLNFNVSEIGIKEFTDALQKNNPDVQISVSVDEKTKVGKVNSSIPLQDLKMPIGYSGGFGLDKDGYIGYLKQGARTTEFVYDNSKTEDDFDKRFVEKEQKIYPEISYEKIREIEIKAREAEIATSAQNMQSGNHLQQLNNQPVLQPKITEGERANRKFKILQMKRAIDEAQNAKNKSAVMAGLCILGAVTSAYFNGQDINAIVQNNLNMLYSWETLGQFFQDLGPLTTLLTVSASGFIVRHLKDLKKLKKVQDEFIDMNASLQVDQELGDNENAKSR